MTRRADKFFAKKLAGGAETGTAHPPYHCRKSRWISFSKGNLGFRR